jgi:hypothetical protein
VCLEIKQFKGVFGIYINKYFFYIVNAYV